MTKSRLVIIATVIAVLVGCSNGYSRSGPDEPLLPMPDEATHSRGATVTVVVGRPGDRWLDTMQWLGVGRGSRDGQHGYEITYAAPNGDTFTLFWSRRDIDFDGARPAYQRIDLPIGNANYLYYPDKVTQESLPSVYRAIMMVEAWYGREADGMITAAEWFAVVASLGPAPKIPKVPRPPPPKPSIPGARVVKGGAGYKAFIKDNFRENLGRMTGGIPESAHAHHVLPVKFEGKCQAAGINIHEPRFGAWWEARAHKASASGYNIRWEQFFEKNAAPSIERILEEGRRIASDYGLQIYF